MKRKFNASYVVIPLVYAVLIFTLIMLQFSGGKLFNVTIGPISLNGSFTMAGGSAKKQLASLTVQVQGIKFVFDKDHPVRLQNPDDSFVDLELQGYTSTNQGFSLSFNHDIQMNIQYVEGTANVVTIGIDLPQSTLAPKSLRLPYQPAGDASITVSQGQQSLDIAWHGNNYQLIMPSRSFADESAKLLVIPGESSRSFRIAQKATGEKNIIEDIQVPSISQKDYQETLGNYITTAYNGWKTSRYNSSSGTWAFRDGENRFSEEAMIDLLAEAWQRDEYTRVFNEMRTTADQHPAQMTWRSAPFMGNLRRVTNELSSLDRDESGRINDLLDQKNNDLYLTPNLFRFALDRGTADLAANLIRYTEALKPEDLQPVQLLGILQNLYLGDLPDPNLETMLGRFNGLIKTAIIPSIIHVDEGFFFQVKPDKSDGYYTVLAGRVLEKAGEKSGDERLVALGRNMVSSVLKLADDLGFVPSQIDFSAGAISAMLKYKGPEDFYWLLQSNSAYPHEVSLYPQLGPGHWFYSLAQVNSINVKPDEYRFNLSYPRSRTHYLFFRGLNTIDPLSGMQLFGITWRNAPDFEVYSKGRYYNPDTKTLMIKYYDDSVQRDIVVWYNR